MMGSLFYTPDQGRFPNEATLRGDKNDKLTGRTACAQGEKQWG